jgi:hypothetical protein
MFYGCIDLLQVNQEDRMVYTQERLTRALDVFRASEPYRKRRGLPGTNLERHLESSCKQYETRSGQSLLTVRTTIAGTWYDDDGSGEYTLGKTKTAAKTQKALQNCKKRKCQEVGRGSENKAPKRARHSYTSGRQNGMSLMVTFKFDSEIAKAKVAELFPLTVSDGGFYPDDLQESLCNADENNTSLAVRSERGLSPALQSTSSSCQALLPESVSDEDLESPRTNFTKTDNPCERNIQHVPTASKSDPIVIDDSDDQLASQTKMIKTDWAHPIDYRSRPEACDFCKDFRFALFGCGTVHIEVIELEPGIYEEMGGGNREKGMEATEICLNCSVGRLGIAQCPAHEILPIDGCLEEFFDSQSFVSHLAASNAPDHPFTLCSICIQPAFYRCGTKQTEDPFGLPIMAENETGCGLLLCRECAGVTARRGFKLDSFDEFAQKSQIFRADRDFLFPGSDLWQAMRNGGRTSGENIIPQRKMIVHRCELKS